MYCNQRSKFNIISIFFKLFYNFSPSRGTISGQSGTTNAAISSDSNAVSGVWQGASVAPAAFLAVRSEPRTGCYRFRRVSDIAPYKSSDPDTSRIWWTDGGVHQNLTFPVQPDPVSGMHCWHQAVTISRAHVGDRYADVYVDTNKSMEIYRQWLARTRPGPGPGNLRRPLWLAPIYNAAITAGFFTGYFFIS